MGVVGFDTATADTAVCATTGGGEVLYEELLGVAPDGSPRHSTGLLVEVEQAAAAAGGWNEVKRLAVGLGPGSFVGIRIGIATARGLATSTGLPVTGVCTLDALGRALGEYAGPERNRLAVLDARRGEVFAALYSPTGERLWAPLVAAPAELAERAAKLPTPPLAGGSGAVRFRNELATVGADVPEDGDAVHRVAARHICALAEAAPERGDEGLEPIYLRAPDAERWRERDTSKRAR
ncbi:MAG TPA: tRNA (adenosine(37)-N6)-threonylcarbamoyltransferase complex dimerization subunit type 1 TsaB [Solirubrobacterales bacterium]|nr:tRNA (adenosine(37)-N6)-threonylcarbamoyltransferase complex dimerization subunit type 1 TsaB [Solirubrobacterales bacterium]